MTPEKGIPYQRHKPSAAVRRFLDPLDPGAYFDCGRAGLKGIDDVLLLEAERRGRVAGEDSFQLVATDTGLIYCRPSISFAIAARWSDIVIARPEGDDPVLMIVTWPTHGNLSFTVGKRLGGNVFRRWLQRQMRVTQARRSTGGRAVVAATPSVETATSQQPAQPAPGVVDLPVPDSKVVVDIKPDGDGGSEAESTPRVESAPEVESEQRKSEPKPEGEVLKSKLHSGPGVGQLGSLRSVGEVADDSTNPGFGPLPLVPTTELQDAQPVAGSVDDSPASPEDFGELVAKAVRASNDTEVDSAVAKQLPNRGVFDTRDKSSSRPQTTKTTPGKRVVLEKSAFGEAAGFEDTETESLSPPSVRQPSKAKELLRTKDLLPVEVSGEHLLADHSSVARSSRETSSRRFNERPLALVVAIFVMGSIGLILMGTQSGSDDGQIAASGPTDPSPRSSIGETRSTIDDTQSTIDNTRYRDLFEQAEQEIAGTSEAADTTSAGYESRAGTTTVESDTQIAGPETSSSDVAGPSEPGAESGALLCNSNYSGCVPDAVDVDCLRDGDGPAYLNKPEMVLGTDVYLLDTDEDGEACEPGQPLFAGRRKP